MIRCLDEVRCYNPETNKLESCFVIEKDSMRINLDVNDSEELKRCLDIWLKIEVGK